MSTVAMTTDPHSFSIPKPTSILPLRTALVDNGRLATRHPFHDKKSPANSPGFFLFGPPHFPRSAHQIRSAHSHRAKPMPNVSRNLKKRISSCSVMVVVFRYEWFYFSSGLPESSWSTSPAGRRRSVKGDLLLSLRRWGRAGSAFWAGRLGLPLFRGVSEWLLLTARGCRLRCGRC